MNTTLSNHRDHGDEQFNKVAALVIAVVVLIGCGHFWFQRYVVGPRAMAKVLDMPIRVPAPSDVELRDVANKWFEIGVYCGAQAAINLLKSGETNPTTELLNAAAFGIWKSRK